MLTSIRGKILKKKNFGPRFGLNQAQNEVFCHFLEFGLYVFFEIDYDDSLR